MKAIINIKNYIKANLLSGLAKTSISLIISILAIPIIIEYIGLEKFGIISIVLIFSNVTGLFDIGLSRVLVTFSHAFEKNIKYISAIYIINFIITFFILTISIVIYFLQINIFGTRLVINENSLVLLNFFAMLVLAMSIINNLFKSTLEAIFKLKYINIGLSIQLIFHYLSWLILALNKASYLSFFFISFMSIFVSTLFYAFLIKDIVKKFTKPNSKDYIFVIKKAYHFFKLGSINSIHLALNKYLLIQFIGDSRIIGIFELSTKLSVVFNNIYSYISTPFFSLTNLYNNESRREELILLIRKTILYLSFISMCIIIGYNIFNKYIIFYFYNEYDNIIYNVLNIILIGYLITSTFEIIQKYYMGLGEVKKVANTKILFNTANFVLVYFLFLFELLDLTMLALIYSLSLILVSVYWLIVFTKTTKQELVT